MVMVVVGEVLLLAAFVVYAADSTDGLTSVGQMIAYIIEAFMRR
jgi:hypothetical protein